MGWAIGYDTDWDRWIGYGVVAYCDHPKCNRTIDRGLGYVCGGKPYGGEKGCGGYFCGEHHAGQWQRCPRCLNNKPRYKTRKPEHPEWIAHLRDHPSWAEWRAENPKRLAALVAQLP